jgi:hypothetical protein
MTFVHFLPCYGGLNPLLYKSTAAAKRKTEICLRSFGQIARRRRVRFLEATAPDTPKNIDVSNRGL